MNSASSLAIIITNAGFALVTLSLHQTELYRPQEEPTNDWTTGATLESYRIEFITLLGYLITIAIIILYYTYYVGGGGVIYIYIYMTVICNCIYVSTTVDSWFVGANEMGSHAG